MSIDVANKLFKGTLYMQYDDGFSIVIEIIHVNWFIRLIYTT